MNMPSVFFNLVQRNKEHRALSKQVVTLTRQLGNLQAATDITTNTDSTSTRAYVGTPTKYSDYARQVAALGALYGNTADWGCPIAKNVIDVRTAFSVGEGLKVTKREGFKGSAEQELEWAKEFMRQNNLDEEMPQEYAKEAEIEGKVLWRFRVDEAARAIRVIHVSWRKYNYTIYSPDYDYFDYIRAEYTGSGEPNLKFDLAAPLFVYKRFGGLSSEINSTPPKTAFVLREIEDIDKALWDWRKVNRLFGSPTPVFIGSDKQTAKEILAMLDTINWRIGKAIVLGGEGVDYKLVGWQGDGYTTLKEEIQALAKTISGTTGVPVHFLGYPELLSNRDTAENLIELMSLSTSKERRTWIGAYEELIQKAMVIYNTAFNTSLNPQAIDVTIEETKLMETLPEDTNETIPKRNDTSAQSAGTGQSD